MRGRWIAVATVAALASLSGASLSGDAGPRVGEAAPMPEAKESIGLSDCSAKALEGKVVYMVLFRTWVGDCKGQVPLLDGLYAKYRDRGLVVLAVTDEPRDLVDRFIADTKARHPIVIESGDSMRAYGAGSFPTTILVDPRGRIAVTGMPQESDIERLLDQTWSIPELPKKLAAVQKTLDKGDYAGSRKALEAQLAGTGLDGAERKAAEGAVKWIDDRGARMLADAGKDEKAGDAYSAALGLRKVSDAFRNTEIGTKAEEALKALLADKAKKREVDAADLLEKNRAKLRAMKPEQAAAWCRSFAKSYEGTKAAEKATALAAQFESGVKK